MQMENQQTKCYFVLNLYKNVQICFECSHNFNSLDYYHRFLTQPGLLEGVVHPKTRIKKDISVIL